jgi:hypothetical protein
VILAFFGDTAVAAKYDAGSKTVSPTFTLYEVGKTLPPFTVTNTGRLRSAGI